MTTPPLVSIIVPIYNTAPYLDRCVASLCGQTYENIEIILVDDGSTDDSGVMCDHYAAADSRIRALHKQNVGLISAWTAGVGKSKGEYLCFVDSDDWVEREMIEAMAGFLDFAPGEMICCNHTIDRLRRGHADEAMTMKAVRHGLAAGAYEGGQYREVYRHLLGNENHLITVSRCMKLISRELIADNIKYCRSELRNGEDMTIIIPAILSARRVVIMEGAYYYHYFFNNDSMVHVYNVGLYEEYRLLVAMLREVFHAKARERGLELGAADIDKQCGQEYILKLLAVLKNEARGNPDYRSYCGRVGEICHDEENRSMVARYPVTVTERANRLLYMVLRRPGRFNIWLLRMATKIFYMVRV